MKRDKLIDNYMPTHSGWFFHPENMVRLHGVEKDGKVHIQESLDMDTYRQLMFSTSGDDARVYYLDIIANEGGLLPEIITDLNASNARSLKLPPNTYMIFKTAHPYNPDRLYKLQVRARVENGGTLYSGLIGLRDEAYLQSDGTLGVDAFYPLVHDTSHQPGSVYKTDVGYVLGVGTSGLAVEAARDPDYPLKLYSGTTDVAMVLKTGASGVCYVDSIELMQMDNDVTEIPGGKDVVAGTRSVRLVSSDPAIMYEARGSLQTDYVTVTAVARNVPVDALDWSVSSGDYQHPKDGGDEDILQVTILDCATVSEDVDRVNIEAFAEVDGVVYSDVLSLPKVRAKDTEPYKFGLITDSPPKQLPNGDELVVGDYFLWGGATQEIEGTEYITGEIYEYSGFMWYKSTNGDLVFTLIDSYTELVNSDTAVDKANIMPNAVIGKLVTLNAFIENLMAQDLEITNTGQIRQNYTADGKGLINTALPGFYLSNGKLKATDADLIGRLRTGEDAPEDARISARERTGIPQAPVYVGTGVDDLQIISDGAYDTGNWQIKITKKNLLHTDAYTFDDGYWSTPIQDSTYLWAAVAANGSVLVKVGSSGYWSRSTDKGVTWSTPARISNVKWQGIACNESTWIMVGAGYYAISTNNGATWGNALPTKNNRYASRIAYNNGVWLMGCHFGYIHKSTDNGSTWVEKRAVSLNDDMSSIVIRNNGTCLAADQSAPLESCSGSVSRSTNYGDTWTKVIASSVYKDKKWQSVRPNYIGNNGSVWIVVGGVSWDEYSTYCWRSIDDGATWSDPIKIIQSYLPLNIAYSNGVWLVVGEYGIWIRSTDNGATWSTPATQGSSIHWLGIAAQNNVFVVVGNGGGSSGFWMRRNIPADILIYYDAIAVKKNTGSFSSDIPLYPARNIAIATDTVIKFGALSGHNIGDTWTFTKIALPALRLADTNGNTYFDALGGKIRLERLPINADNLIVGQLWRDGDTLKIKT